MAWTTIPDTSLEPGKPIRSIDILALRDNPIAISAGDVGAPRNEDPSLSTTATNTGRDWVLARSALSTAGAIGTYAFAKSNTAGDTAFGATRAGSTLLTASAASQVSVITSDYGFLLLSGAALSGTWRCMGTFDQIATTSGNSTYGATLWLRIA